MKLKVIPKPVVRKEMQLPKTQFNEKETLTIVCQFDARPEEAFMFLHNEKPIVPDSRVTTTVEDNKYTIVVKDLRPEDEGVYTLKSDHLILDTPSVTVVPEEKKPQIETTTVEEEEETIAITQQQPETKEVIEEEKVVGLFLLFVFSFFVNLNHNAIIKLTNIINFLLVYRKLRKNQNYLYMMSKRQVQ
jgi:hypothetical protein